MTEAPAARPPAAPAAGGAAELLRLSLAELAERIRARRVSPVELMQAVLARLDARNGELNAVVAMRPREALLADARAAEARVARGEARPLEGIPLGVKDLEDAEGLPNSEGSRLFATRIPERDTTQVRRLRDAGAILLGKTNAPEFGHTALTKNLLYGATGSPWDPALTPGGSSGGSAAALAGGLLPLVTASDGGGSIRIPASFTGCFGLKVSHGRVPRDPFDAWDYEVTSVAGPLTKTVADAALLLDLTCGASPGDPHALPHPGLSYRRALEEPLPAGLRIGFSPDLGYAVVQSDVAAVVEDAARAFARMGHTLVSIEGGPPELGAGWGLLSAFQLLARLHPLLPERAGELTRSLARGLESARQMTPEHWGRLARERGALCAWAAGVFERVDLLLTPTVPYDPPPARGPFPSETEGRAQSPFGVASFTIPWNLAWNPAASVRAGLSRRGLPVGLQLVGPRHRDDLVLRAALAFERERPWHPQWPIR